MNNAATDKAVEERGIFERFAKAAGLAVRAGSITQPDPPDILCDIEDFGQVGFELVQLDDQTELQRMKYLGRGPEFWEDTLREIPGDVVERHRKAQVNVTFDAKANQSRRRSAFKLIAEALQKLPEGAEGGLLEKLPDGLRSAELRFFRGIAHGPIMREFSDFGLEFEPGRVAPVGIDFQRIQGKIDRYAKGWETRAELLAYSRWGMPFSDQAHDAQGFLSSCFPAGIFERGWIFELTSGEVIARAPRELRK